MELQQLRYFVAVAEQGGFSRAAEHCRVAQPSLSQQIRKLEEELGARLFDRMGRRVALTDAGRALLPRARRILAEVRDASQCLPGDLEAGHGRLAVGAIPTVAPYLLPPLLAVFRERFPHCELTVREDLTGRLVEGLASAELDVALASTPVDGTQVEVETIGRERLLLAVPTGHALAEEGKRAALADLATEPVIMLHEMHCLGQQIQGMCTMRRVRPRVVCRSTQLATVIRLVERGVGISLVPETARSGDALPGVTLVGLGREAPARDITVLWRKGRSRSRLATEFAVEAKRALKALLGASC